jgi:NTE family protein
MGVIADRLIRQPRAVSKLKLPGHAPRRSKRVRPQEQPVTLALEGGGSYGAFEWGVLDRLLDTRELRIEAVSGASAGAMNAAMLVQGLGSGGPADAKRLLDEFWHRVAAAAGSPAPDLAPWLWSLPGLLEAFRQTRAVPAQISVMLGLNPLRAILNDLLDTSVFGRPGTPRLIVSATRVRTGEARLFCDSEVTVDALLASACLPQLFPAVEINGEAYWDGGYSSNPPLRPLIEAGAPADVILVRTTPLEQTEVPTTHTDIETRAAELGFGAALRQELRSLAVAQHLLADLPALSGSLARLRDARLHMISAEAEFRALKGKGRLQPTWNFLRGLHDTGVAVTEEWLDENLSAIGHRPTIDLSTFAGPVLDDHPSS